MGEGRKKKKSYAGRDNHSHIGLEENLA